ncbi:hypothetical protein DSL72_004328 [Monilinia vaccinii-corymbosi]|uniref:Cytochrome P450 n=1 Tax=Monilinia vaccinii-corymbosi TaxID=61207 RepID=A0A8A3P073_9HELO|nr:hypothetical protein DSL72_004328 [Monilinia vaccinii-corymbosi]
MASNISDWSHVISGIDGRKFSSLETILQYFNQQQDAIAITSLETITHLKLQDATVIQQIRAAYMAAIAIAFSFLLNYVFTRLSFERGRRSNDAALATPPTIPYWLPFLGSSLDFGFNALAFIRSSTKLSRNSPFCVSLLNQKIFFVQGAENIAALWKKSSTMTGTLLHLFCLKYIFGMPSEALEMYAKDNSGLAAQPPPGSSVAPNNRVDYRTHVGMLKFTKGAGLSNFCDRLVTGFRRRLAALPVSDQEWLELPDFMAFFNENFGSALIESICGPSLTRLSPDFAKDLSTYDTKIPGLLKGLPRWLIPDAYDARDKLLASIKQWHAFARAHFEEASISADGDADPYWGSLFIRERQTMWAALETFKDPAVLERVRTELSGAFDPNAIHRAAFDAYTLQTLPLLQSIYAETLRLRVRAYAARYTDRAAFSIKNWLFPKKSIILVSTTEAHMDESFWNTKGGMHPITEFWADRFLIYEDDPTSGPQSKAQLSQAQPNDLKEAAAGPAKGPKFSLAGTNGSWLPYGGGARACIGQTFSKRVMLAACAIMAMEFDVEILAGEKALEMDPKFYGLGGQRPVGKVPFKIRRRVTGFPGRP